MIARMLLAVVAIALLVVAVPTPDHTAAAQVDGRYQAYGDPGGFLNILPPGQDGVLNGPEAILAQTGQYPPHVQDQLGMYGDLVYNTPGLTEDRLTEFFKDASFGVKADDIDRVYSPTPGVTIIRDKSFGVPHIFGETRYATMFAQGYTGAEDRLFLMDALRHVGRGRASEFLGASPANMALDRDQVSIAPYKESDLTAQLNAAVASAGPEGQQLYDDLLAYVDGVNKYINEALLDPTKLPAEYAALQQVPTPWKPEDTVAVASLVGGIFGKGGGGELRNHCGLEALGWQLRDRDEARRVFDDVHFANDPEAPATATGTFPYMTDLGPVDPAANPNVDCPTLQPVDNYATSVDDILPAISGELGVVQMDAPWGPITLNFNDTMSNAILVNGDKTETGHPIAVFGPQTSYYIPQLLIEKDVHGPGIDARGASFAGTDLYVQLGRGRDYAWSATSASADNVDQWVLKLCEPGGGTPTEESMGYLHNGACKQIETYQHTQIAKPSAGGLPAGPDVVLSWRIERSEDYGPISARGRLTDGTPIAIATLRSTYFNELGSARGFSRINNPDFMTNGFDSFRDAMGKGVDYTFNWFYIDTNDIGYQHSCLCPQRAQGVDPYLPAWGTGQWDWQGWIPFEAQPHDLNPATGYLSSWNNKQAPGFMANDRQFNYGPVYRDQLLSVRMERAMAAGEVDRGDVVDVMELAGTTDLRAQEVLPYILQVLGDPLPVADAQAIEMRDRLAAWVSAGAHRRDHDRDGEYDDAVSPMVLDQIWEDLSYFVLGGYMNNPIDSFGLELDDGNRLAHIGSAFQGGTHGQIQKELRTLLGLPVDGPFHKSYCAGGDLQQCRAGLWNILKVNGDRLEAQFGSPNVADWKRAVADEDVRHSAVGVTAVPAIHWINRPTFQQVVQINSPHAAGETWGYGATTGPAGKDLAFTFWAKAPKDDGLGVGRFSLYDYSTGQKLEIKEVTFARARAGPGCGSIESSATNSFEFEGIGKLNGVSGYKFHVCVQDNAEPGVGSDRLHVNCIVGCSYDSSPPYSTEIVSSGNLRVVPYGAPPAAGGTPSSVELKQSSPLAPLTAVVYDANGAALPGVPVKLAGVGALPLTAVTDALGNAVFLVNPLFSGVTKATAGGVQSNPLKLGP